MPVLGIVGARGRLGSAVAGAAGAAGWQVGLTAGRDGWTVREMPDVLVDASHRSALPAVEGFCQRHQVPLVSTTSGLSAHDEARLEALARSVPVVRTPNLALGHSLQRDLVGRLAALVAGRGDTRVTVTERHPTTKLDRPSATALVLAGVWLTGSGIPAVSVDSVRGGMPVSDHSVALAFDGEELVITHSVRSLTLPARRAVEIAAWATSVAAGLYSTADAYHVAVSTIPTPHNSGKGG